MAVLAALAVLPQPIANWFYDRVAKNRYRIFGKYDTCMTPSAELEARLVE